MVDSNQNTAACFFDSFIFPWNFPVVPPALRVSAHMEFSEDLYSYKRTERQTILELHAKLWKRIIQHKNTEF